jgi:SNF2 family DNA or RNA helicase
MNESLRDLDLKISYGPRDNRLKDFYIPCLSSSVRFDRSAGYFSSATLTIAATGVVKLIANEGKMRLLVGADLSEEDVAVINSPTELASRVERSMLLALRDPESDFELKRLEILAWMVSTGSLEIKVVLPQDDDGRVIPSDQAYEYYHPKEGIFYDAFGDIVAFSGSVNESERAWEKNYEQFDVFSSWSLTGMYVTEKIKRFKRLWEDREPDWVALPIPEAVEKKLLNFKPTKPPKHDPAEGIDEQEEEGREEAVKLSDREKLVLRFISDLPYMPSAAGLAEATCAIKLWPHQRKVANRIVQTYPDNYLLCDEVGLGKTIEAGVALRQLLLSGQVHRCLILVPKSVARQWQEELYEKFLLNIPLLQGNGFIDVFKNELDYNFDNLWNSHPCIIASSQLAKRRDKQDQLIDAGPWDLVLIDEAHHARRKEFLTHSYRPNRLLELLTRLRTRTKCLLFLTATPMQLNQVEMWDLLNMLGMGGKWGASEDFFIRYFRELRQNPREIDWSFIFKMMKDYYPDEDSWDPLLRKMAEEFLGPVEWGKVLSLVREAVAPSGKINISDEAYKILLELAKSHTPIRHYMFRNTRELLRKYRERGLLDEKVPSRNPRLVWIEMEKDEYELYERIDEYISDFYHKYESERKGLGFVMTVYRRRLTSSFYAIQQSLQRRRQFIQGVVRVESQGLTEDDIEQEELDLDIGEEIDEEDRLLFREELEYIDDFLHQIESLGTDTKLKRLLQDLNEIFKRRETVIIFTQYTDTMDYLRDGLIGIYGTKVACYSGREGEYWDGVMWQPTSKEEIKRKFAEGDEVKILLCTEAASEGLNLQTCGVLINYDMPWNPMRVEQRIGRIDRIGQLYDVVDIFNYFYTDTVEASIYSRLEDRIDWFNWVVGRLQPILYRVSETIKTISLTPREERQKRLDQELEKLKDEFASLEEDTMDLDNMIDPSIEKGAVKGPITLSQIKELLLGSEALSSYFHDYPEIDGAYILAYDGANRAVTFDPAVFDSYSDKLNLMTFGDEAFQGFISFLIENESLEGMPLIRAEVREPVKMVAYYSVDENILRRIDDLETLMLSLEASQNVDVLPELHARAAEELGRISLGREAGMQDREKQKRSYEREALLEKGRRLLEEATYIQMAISQQASLFDEGVDIPMDFSLEAVQRSVSRQGYPFSGLLKMVGWEGIELSSMDDFYLGIKDLPPELLRGRLDGIKNRAKQLLDALVVS